MSTAPTVDQQDQKDTGEHGISEEQRDSTVLNLMLCDGSGFAWSVEEIARTIDDRLDAVDAVRRLEAAGLLHRIGELVFPTLAARRADELGAGAI